MQTKPVLLLLVLALGLGAYVYFYEIQGAEKREEAKDAEKQLFNLASSDLKSLQVENDNGLFVFERRNDLWWLTKPLETEADSNGLDDVLFALNHMRFSKVVDENPSDLSAFGLDAPRYRVTATTNEGTQSLSVGDQAPIGREVYIGRSDDTRVFLTKTAFDLKLGKKLQEWRDHKVLHFSVPDVQSLRVEGPGFDALLFERDDDGWNTPIRPELRLDGIAIESLLFELQSLRVRTFTGQKDVHTFGLESPQRIVTLVTHNSEEPLQLLLGEPIGEEGDIPAVLGDGSGASKGDEIRLVDNTLMASFNQPLSQFRSKQILDIARDDVTSVEARMPTSSVKAHLEGDEWQIDGAAAAYVMGTDIEAILDDLVGLKAEKVIDGVSQEDWGMYGLEDSDLTIELQGKEGSTEIRLHLGEVDVGDDKEVYARLESEPTLFKVHKFLVEDIHDVLIKKGSSSAPLIPLPVGDTGTPATPLAGE